MSIEESRYSGLKKKCVINYLQSESNDHCNIGHIDIGVWIAIDLTSILLIYVICIYVSIHETVLDRGEVKSNDLYESAVGFGEVSSKERIGRRCRKAPSLYDSLGRSEEKPIHWYSLVFNAFVPSVHFCQRVTSRLRMNEFMYRDKCSTWQPFTCKHASINPWREWNVTLW